jgi:hypothetical protein
MMAAPEVVRPTRGLEDVFDELTNLAYALGVQWQDSLDPEDDVTQLRLSDWLDESHALISLLDVRREARV